MSVSAEISTPTDLYCNETATDVLSSNAAAISGTDSTSSTGFLLDDESFNDDVFDSELDQRLEPALVTRCLEHPKAITAHHDAVNWMLKQGKGWPLQLLAVACLSLSAKLEETSVPLLLDIQILQPRFLFRPNTVQRMELLVMSKLKWRLRTVTPFYFLHYFVAKLSHLCPSFDNFSSILSETSDLIISQCRAINILDCTPSTIAAAAVLWVTHQSIDEPTLGCFHKRLDKEMVKRCYNLIKHNASLLTNGKTHDATTRGRCHAKKYCNRNLKSSNKSPPNQF